MFDPYAESSSTGEPPTESSAQLSVQEPDSGYEASPSSIAENQRFFGEQSNGSRQSDIGQSSSLSVNSDDDNIEFDEQILLSNSESDDYDTCPECSSSAVSCSCFIRTDSSNTNCTATSICDNSRCSSGDQFIRPSSQPIQIPILHSRITSDASRRIVIGSPVNIGLLTRSQPTNFSPLHRLDLISGRQNSSWPSRPSTNLALNSPRRNCSIRDIPRHNVRRNSEGSSYNTSEDEEEGPEDVFHMPEEAASFPTMMTMSSAPLPDVVLESDTGRRSRSMSINLPPDRAQILYNVGRNLRRMSDEFVQRRQLSMALRGRSRTESECGDHLHRNGLS